MLFQYIAIAVTLVQVADSMCPKPCAVKMLSVWPNQGYRASVLVKAPMNYRKQKPFRINMFFNIAPERAENLSVLGGSINQLQSKLLGKRITILFRPDQRIRKGSHVKIEFIVRHQSKMPMLTEVRFWKKVVCSSAVCPTGNGLSTAMPMTTKASQFPKCGKNVKILDLAPDYVKIRLDLPVASSMSGWSLEILFDKPVLGISNFPALLDEERNKQYFILRNLVYNKDIDAGTFNFMLLAHFDLDRNYESHPKISMLKFGSFICKLNDAITIPPTTTAPPSTKPLPTTAKSTTKPEVATTEAPVTTPEVTDEPEVITTQAPATTPEVTGDPEVTTNIQVTTLQPEITTEQTEKPPTVAPETTKKPEKTTVKPEPETTSSKPETTISKVTTEEQKTTSSPSCKPEFDYSQVLNLSLLFYEAQRSGKLPASNRIPYRKDSATNDGKDVGKDLTGGYYDAGDFVKFNFPMAYTITVLSWGAIQYEDAYKASGQYQYMLDAIKWGTDYFIKCHTAKLELYGQVGDGDADHAYWGRAEDMTVNRPSAKIDESKPGSDLAGETAAALAAASVVFKSNSKYSQTLLAHAKELYDFADKFRGRYSDSIPNAAKFYKSWSGFNDELTWAAAWLYRASNEAKYLTAAKSFYTQFGMNSNPQEFSWDDKKAGVQVLMAQITSESIYKENVKAFCSSVLQKPRTPAGLVFISQWGANRHAANVAFICLLAADLGINQAEYRSFARSQIHYMLGKPNSPRSFVVGFGKNPPRRPHHRSSSCPKAPEVCDWNDFNSAAPNPRILYGALVGGPGKNDDYADNRNDYVKNEVACDYNAGFQSALAALKHLELNGKC